MMIELVEGLNAVTVPLSPSAVSAPVIQRFFVVTIPRADKGEYEIHCLIENTGEAAGTHKVTLYYDGDAVESETFTIEPGQTYDYVYSWSMAPRGTSGTVWVVGDWGEETLHIRFTAGYSTTAFADVDCVAVTANTAILRYSARSDTNEWRVSYCTPPGWSNTEHSGRFTIKASGSWTAMWCVLRDLLPAHRYEADISGYDYGTRTAWTEFTTR